MTITAIMPTADRPQFVAAACELFLAQTVQDAELLVLDNGVQRIGELLPKHDRIHYCRTSPGQTLGALRNFCCGLATREFVAHWDDDDYYWPGRLREQLDAIGTADICGYHSIQFASESGGRWSYQCPPGMLLGNSLFYRRAFWEQHKFQAMRECDEPFVTNSRRTRIVALDCTHGCCAWIHAGNSSPKRTDTPGWSPIHVTNSSLPLLPELDG
jgi:glycosyltransferase involved in cell wall biosynthesis